MNKQWRKLIAAIVIIIIFIAVVAAFVARSTAPLMVVFTGNGVAKGGNPVATFVLTNLTARQYIAFGRNGPDALYCEYRDTFPTGQTNWIDGYAPGQRQWIIDVDPHSGVAFTIPLPQAGGTREFAVLYTAKLKENPSGLDAMVQRAVDLFRRHVPKKTERAWYKGVLRGSNAPVAMPPTLPGK